MLKDRGISYSLKKGERQAEPTSIFGRVLDLGIRVKLNPKDWLDGDELCVLPAPRPMLAKRTYSVEQVRAILKPKGPPPDDATIKQWIDEHRIEKYGQ